MPAHRFLLAAAGVDLQILGATRQARVEGRAATARLSGFDGVVVGRVLALTPPSGTRRIAAQDRAALRPILAP